MPTFLLKVLVCDSGVLAGNAYDMSSSSIGYHCRSAAARFAYAVGVLGGSRNRLSNRAFRDPFLLRDNVGCSSILNRPIYNPSLVWRQLRSTTTIARY